MTVPGTGGSPQARSSLVQADSYCKPKKWSCGKWMDCRKVAINGLDISKADWLGREDYRFSEDFNWSAPAERSDDGALVVVLRGESKAVSRSACHRTPK